MRARGGYEVDIEWKDGKLTQAVVRGVSNGPAPCVVRYGKGASTFTLAKGESRVLRAAISGSRERKANPVRRFQAQTIT